MTFQGFGLRVPTGINLQQVWEVLEADDWIFRYARGCDLHWVRGPLTCVIQVNNATECLINQDLSTVPVTGSHWVHIGVDSTGRVWVHRNEVRGSDD